MDAGDLELRRRTYARFVELGRAPAPDELGAREDVLAGWQRLHDAHALVLNPATDELRMANPFSAVPTAYRVRAAGRWCTRTAHGTRSASAPRCTSTAGSRRRAP